MAQDSPRLDRLDNGFLYLLGFVSLVISLVESAFGGLSGLLKFSPAIVVTAFVPFYVGYLRGAIFHPSVVERARGWTYLCIGASVVTSLLVLETPQYSWIGFYVGPIWPVMFAMLGAFVARKVCHEIFRAFDVKTTEATKVVFVGTSLAAAASPFLLTTVPSVLSTPASLALNFGGIAMHVVGWSTIVIFGLEFAILERTCEALSDSWNWGPLLTDIMLVRPGWLFAFVAFLGAASSSLYHRKVAIPLILSVIVWASHLPFYATGYLFWAYIFSWSGATLLGVVALVLYTRVDEKNLINLAVFESRFGKNKTMPNPEQHKAPEQDC